MEEFQKTLIVMRGLPAAGKSYRAKEILEEHKRQGIEGCIYSTDEYFYKVEKPEQPDVYSFNPERLSQAHQWNQQRCFRSIDAGLPLVIVDNTNTTAPEAFAYVNYAVSHGYRVCIEEPTSEWWQKIRTLLLQKTVYKKELADWAAVLTEKSRQTHSVPVFAIEKMIGRWECDLTVEKILASKPIRN